jgi:ribosomal protein S18 acetylase RimI-like enzyme
VRADELQLVRLDSEDAGPHLPAIAEWVLDAGAPHLEWLYMGDRERALGIVRDLLASERSELWAGFATVLVEDGRAIGGYLALPGRELPDRRKADLTSLIRATPRENRAELRRRVELGDDLYLPVEPDHRFLSKIGLLAGHRGRGLGGALLDAFVAESWEQGYRHIRLDVARGDGRVVRLYESRGFEAVGSRSLEPLGVEYVAMILGRRAHA